MLAIPRPTATQSDLSDPPASPVAPSHIERQIRSINAAALSPKPYPVARTTFSCIQSNSNSLKARQAVESNSATIAPRVQQTNPQVTQRSRSEGQSARYRSNSTTFAARAARCRTSQPPAHPPRVDKPREPIRVTACQYNTRGSFAEPCSTRGYQASSLQCIEPTSTQAERAGSVQNVPVPRPAIGREIVWPLVHIREGGEIVSPTRARGALSLPTSNAIIWSQRAEKALVAHEKRREAQRRPSWLTRSPEKPREGPRGSPEAQRSPEKAREGPRGSGRVGGATLGSLYATRASNPS